MSINFSNNMTSNYNYRQYQINKSNQTTSNVILVENNLILKNERKKNMKFLFNSITKG